MTKSKKLHLHKIYFTEFKKFALVTEPEKIGRLFGSGQPGRIIPGKKNDGNVVALEISDGEIIEIDEQLYNSLQSIYDYENKIKIIYNLIHKNDIEAGQITPEFLKIVWERLSPGETSYITEINGHDIGFGNHNPPTPEVLNIVSADIISNLTRGENVLVHCLMGSGRTGAILTAVFMRINCVTDHIKAIRHVRNHYRKDAVESNQFDALEIFGHYLEETECKKKEEEFLVKSASTRTLLPAVVQEHLLETFAPQIPVAALIPPSSSTTNNNNEVYHLNVRGSNDTIYNYDENYNPVLITGIEYANFLK